MKRYKRICVCMTIVLFVFHAGVEFLRADETAKWKLDFKKLKVPLIIDFGTAMPVSQYDIFTNVENRSIKDGKILHLILAEEKDAAFYIPQARGMKPADYAYAGVEIRMKVKLSAGRKERKDNLTFLWTNNDGEYFLQCQLRDIRGKEFVTYRFELADNQDWMSTPLHSVRFALDYSPGTVIDIDYVRFNVPLRKELENKVFNARLRLFYLDNVVSGFAGYGIKVKGLEENINRFRDGTNEAIRLWRKSVVSGKEEDADEAYEKIISVDKLLRDFYPDIVAGRSLAELKDKLTAVEEVIGLCRASGKRVNLPLARVKQQYDKLSAVLARGDFDIKAKVDSINRKIEGFYVKLDKASPCEFPLRLGLSHTSFGRFGWSIANAKYGEGLLIYNVTQKGYLVKEHDNLVLGINPGRGSTKLVSDKKEDVNWVSYKRSRVYEDREGKKIRWDLICSLLAPGPVLYTDGKEVRLGAKHAPDKLLIPLGDKCKVIKLEDGENRIELSENWVLLLWDEVRSKMKFSPVLLVLEKKPQLFKRSKRDLTIVNEGGIGHIGIVDYKGVMPFDKGDIKEWEEKVPGELVSKCRRISRIMTTYPVTCKEFFGIDEEKREVFIRNEMDYLSIRDEWGSKEEKYAPLPPLLNFVSDRGYPAKLPVELIDFNLPTKYGPYKAVKGNMIEYRIPIPDFHHRCPVDAKEMNKLRAWFPVYHRPEKMMPRFDIPSYGGVIKRLGVGPWGFFSHGPFPSMLSAWNLLKPESRDILVGQIGRWYDIYFNRLTDCFGTLENANFLRPNQPWVFIDRVEPFTGKYYMQGGSLWFHFGHGIGPGCMMNRHGFEGLGDTTNQSSRQIEKLYCYAKYSGNWDYIREHWDMITRVFTCITRQNDWANFAISYYECAADTHFDMGPDSLRGPIGMMYLSRQIGDEEYYYWGTYLASKNAMTVLAQFPMAEYLKEYSTKPLPENICWESGLSEYGLPTSAKGSTACEPVLDMKSKKRNQRCSLVTNIYSGCNYMLEILDLRSQYMVEPFKKFVCTTYPSYFPEWESPSYKDQSLWHTARQLMVMEIAGETTERLRFLLKELQLLVPSHRISKALQMFLPFSQIQGRTAPCYLTAWEPNKLVKGSYDPKTSKAHIGIEAKSGGVVKLKSMMKPVSISDNNRIMSNKDWKYDKEREILTVNVSGPGVHNFAIDYTGWKKPGAK